MLRKLVSWLRLDHPTPCQFLIGPLPRQVAIKRTSRPRTEGESRIGPTLPVSWFAMLQFTIHGLMRLQAFDNEAMIWQGLKHPNISPLLGTLIGSEEGFVSPWYSNGDILSYLLSHPWADASKLKMVSVESRKLSRLTHIYPRPAHGGRERPAVPPFSGVCTRRHQTGKLESSNALPRHNKLIPPSRIIS